jgi:hypothetical protein
VDRRDPFPLRRYVVAGLLAAVGVGALLLLVRPFIFSFASPLTDANYTVASAATIQARPAAVEIVLSERHGWPGEVKREDELFSLTVIVSAVGPSAFSVVDAWSPTHDCAVTLGADRLTDCAGDTWTFNGIPIDPADPPLVAFPTTEKSGAVVTDFTRTTGAVS